MTTQIKALEARLKTLKNLYQILLDNPHKTIQLYVTAKRLLNDMASVEKQLADLKFNEALQ